MKPDRLKTLVELIVLLSAIFKLPVTLIAIVVILVLCCFLHQLTIAMDSISNRTNNLR